MARGRRKVNTDTMDAKIEQQKAVLKSEHSYTEIMAFIKGETEE